MPTSRHCPQVTHEHESPPHHCSIIEKKEVLGTEARPPKSVVPVFTRSSLIKPSFTPFINTTFPPFNNLNLQILIMTGFYLIFYRYVVVSVYSRTPDSVVGRISALSSALARTIAIILLAGLLPGVQADCWTDAYVSC